MKAIVLKRRSFRESDQIISLYTQEEGKLELLARGVKKITSKNAAHLEPFSLLEIEVAKGKEIDHLTKVQSLNYFSPIRKDLSKSLSASYLVSFLDKMIETGERDERIFALTKEWLEFVDQMGEFNLILLDSCIVILLYCLGFGIELTNCVVCGSDSQEKGFFFAGGGVICPKCRLEQEKMNEQIINFSPELEKNLKVLLQGDWQMISQLKFETRELHELIYQFLIYHIEKKIEDWQNLTKV